MVIVEIIYWKPEKTQHLYNWKFMSQKKKITSDDYFKSKKAHYEKSLVGSKDLMVANIVEIVCFVKF